MLTHRLRGQRVLVYSCDPGQVPRLRCAEITSTCKFTYMKTPVHAECSEQAWQHTKDPSLVSDNSRESQVNLGSTDFILHYQAQFITLASQGRAVEARTETEAMEDHCLLAFSDQYIQLRPPRPGMAQPQCAVKKMPHTMTTGQSRGANFSVGIPFSHICLGFESGQNHH